MRYKLMLFILAVLIVLPIGLRADDWTFDVRRVGDVETRVSYEADTIIYEATIEIRDSVVVEYGRVMVGMWTKPDGKQLRDASFVVDSVRVYGRNVKNLRREGWR